MEGKIIIVGATGYTGSALAKLLKQENIDCHLIGRNESTGVRKKYQISL